MVDANNLKGKAEEVKNKGKGLLDSLKSKFGKK